MLGLGCFEKLHHFNSTSVILQLEPGDTRCLKFKWRDQGLNPRPLAPQAKSLTTRPPPLPIEICILSQSL